MEGGNPGTLVVPEKCYLFVDRYVVPGETDETCIAQIMEVAEQLGLAGKLMEQTGFCNLDTMSKAIAKVVPARKQHLVPKNVEAIELGMNYKG